MERDFNELLRTNWREQKFLCVGLDPDYEKIPEDMRKGDMHETLVAFNRAIIDATAATACAYKPNTAFYEAHGDEGFAALRETCLYALEHAPHAALILDAKRADIGNTNQGYVAAAFDKLRADAVTVQPYAGFSALEPFFEDPHKGVLVWCRSSNEGAGEFQDLEVDGEPLYLRVARNVAEKWNGNGNCGLVVGATYPEDIQRVRTVAPTVPFLVPGSGAQGGDLGASVRAARTPEGGFILSVSRAIANVAGDDYAEAVRAKADEFDAAIRAAFV